LRTRRAVLVTDRFAVHPLCFSTDGSRISFSDRAETVPQRTAPAVDRQAIFDYAYFHMIPSPRTIFHRVWRVEPAQVVQFDSRGIQSSFWWQPSFAPDAAADLPALKVEFRDLLRKAVEREATTERLGAFLSGGTDSSTIAGLVGQVTGRPPQTFSIGFDAAGYDEMGFARIAASHFGAVQHEYYITPGDLVRSIPRVAASYDQPFGNSSALPAFYCAEQAREAGIEKMLAGDGGDELFGGNTRYAKQKVFDVYGRLPKGLREAAIEPLLLGTTWARRAPLLKKAASYVEQARIPMPDRTETYNLLKRFGPEAVFQGDFLHALDADAPRDLQRTVYARQQATAFVDRMLAYDWRFTLADNDLPKVLGTTQLAGRQVGFPFLDDDLLDFSCRLAPQLKVRALKLRYFFKEALRDFLPQQIIRKSKHGFGLPFGPWLLRSAALRELARAALEGLVARGIIRAELVNELFSTRLPEHAGYFGEMIWILMMLEHWLVVKAPAYKAD
jgi:asparagine synthase (glutamine-hydrolysing)